MTALLAQLPGLLALLGIGFVIYWLLLVALTLWMLTHPPRRGFAAALARGLPTDPGECDPPRAFESWTLRTRGRDLPVWDIPGDDPAAPIAVYSHGWGRGKIDILARLPALLPACSRIIAWDMRGQAEAPPGPCPIGASEHLDLLNLLDRIDPTERTDRGVILYGFSLGAGAAIVAGAQHPPGLVGVIAEAPYRLPRSPARGVMQLRNLPHRLNLRPALGLLGLANGMGLRWTKFDRTAHAAALPCPLLVVHGRLDRVCPLDDGQAIAHAPPAGSIAIIDRGAHNDLWTEPDLAQQAGEAVRAFIGDL